MSVLLATSLVMSGLTFDCRVQTAYLTVFAPSEQVTANYRGNVLTLYKVSGDGEVIAADNRISQVFDSLPSSLFIELTASEFDLEIDINEYDATTNMSKIKLTGKPKVGEPHSVTGTCKVMESEGAKAS